MRSEYRRRRSSDVWHFHPRCRWFPGLRSSAVQRIFVKPTTGEFCNECLAKERREARKGAETLKRGLADLNAGRVEPFEVREIDPLS